MTLACIVSTGLTARGTDVSNVFRYWHVRLLTSRSTLNIMPRKQDLNQIIKSIQQR